MSSVEESGVTMSCSKVPRSRSLTTPMAVMMVAMNTMTTPTRPGIMEFAERRSGL